jgi:hypothetical protein
MNPAQQLRLDMLRSTAYQVLHDLDAETDATQLGTLLILTIIAIDKVIPPPSDKPVSAAQ